ncbi:GNAT family N-acetyltransferase [Tuanshanicoccus lijuaniae]|uniref:GNAT family N-acetyltransferase n=1 Tax=Aerococcaceae bacterium zg-1292 TaxID=2774330 RepID=UPI001BD8191C|nr:GNAT family N-acetyltransferase [Aerococcaceae bacterium zg-A91]MBS4457513.1 GNAT family N-acetyltransferase [Aerococcaceae bacterium zg-BR33]
MKELETQRLRLRKLRQDDAPKIYYGWANNAEVTKYLTWDPHDSIDVTQQILDTWLAAYQNQQTVRYGIELKETAELIGMIDIADFWEASPVVGYVLGEKYWNQGFMTEAFSAVVSYLFELGYSKIFIEAEVENLGSNAVIIKNNFQLIKQEVRPRSQFNEDMVTVNVYQKWNPSLK